jgi:Domain of unknown function (DUF4169)
MGEIISLKPRRKALEKRAKEQKSAENRAIYGQSLAQKRLQARQDKQAAEKFDQHRLEKPPGKPPAL